jgi:HD-GYP domain-containing protein (c-di-GMP phosphodiesterase class II)
MRHVAQFRKLKNPASATNRQSTTHKAKLSFVGLAKDQPVLGNARKKAVPDKSRKILYKEAAAYVREVIDSVRHRKAFKLEKGLQIIQNAVAINHPQDPLFILALHQDNLPQYVIHHPVNVSIFAIKMAAHLGFAKGGQVEIGMAGLLHDVGMAAIPDKILFQKGKLNKEEKRLFQRCPNFSYKILRTLGNQYAYLAECAVQVHERIDGTGYPRGLKADEIHEYAQIIGLLDVYESLIHSRPQRGKATPFAAVKKLINTSKNQFKRTYLKALLSIFTAFPIHSYVRLNSDAIGKVIETYVDQPLRPKIQILYDSQRRKVLTEKIVSLPDDPLLHIVDSVNENEIRQLVGT